MNKYTVDYAHSNIQFSVKHMMISRIHGSFESYTADIAIGDIQDICDAEIKIVINVASVSTKYLDRDHHLISSDFFNADLYPKITFQATAITKVGDTSFDVLGDLSIKDVIRPILFKVQNTGYDINPWGQKVIGYTASTQIDRRNFNLVYNTVLATGGLLISDDIDIFVDFQINPL